MDQYVKNPDDAELTLTEVVDAFLELKWWFAFFIVSVTGATTVASLVLPKKYEAVVLLSPVTNSSTNGLLSGLNTMVSQFSGLASLAGLSQSNDSTKSESLAVLESEFLTEQYIEQNHLLPILFADDWNPKTNSWKNLDTKHVPTLWKGNQYFKNKVRMVTTDAKTGLVTLTISWKDPAVAARWANDLVHLTNETRRDTAIRASERNIAYLTTEATKTDVVGVKQAIYTILQSEISKMMLAKGNDEYALKVIDPAQPPEKAASPQPLLWTSIAFLSTVVASVLISFFRASLKHD